MGEARRCTNYDRFPFCLYQGRRQNKEVNKCQN